MSKTLHIPNEEAKNGITVTYTKSSNTIFISGWYDNCTAIEGRKYKLDQFLLELGIADDDITRTLSKVTVSGYKRNKPCQIKKM
jgi:hypothetical protein